MRVVTEQEFAARIRERLTGLDHVGSVTGPGRSGAVAAVYASHILGIPYIPFGQAAPANLGRILIIDTAIDSGQTLRKAHRRYAYSQPVMLALFEEPPRVIFWYEASKPQHFRHEQLVKSG